MIMQYFALQTPCWQRLRKRENLRNRIVADTADQLVNDEDAIVRLGRGPFFNLASPDGRRHRGPGRCSHRKARMSRAMIVGSPVCTDGERTVHTFIVAQA